MYPCAHAGSPLEEEPPVLVRFSGPRMLTRPSKGGGGIHSEGHRVRPTVSLSYCAARWIDAAATHALQGGFECEREGFVVLSTPTGLLPPAYPASAPKWGGVNFFDFLL